MDSTETEEMEEDACLWGRRAVPEVLLESCTYPLRLLSEVMQRAGFAVSIHDTILAVLTEPALPRAVLRPPQGREGGVSREGAAASSSLLVWNDGKRAPR